MESKLETKRKTIKKTKNVFLNKFNFSIVIMVCIFYLVRYYTTVNLWINVVRAMPGTKLHPDVDRDIVSENHHCKLVKFINDIDQIVWIN